jgi:hypothetical protein
MRTTCRDHPTCNGAAHLCRQLNGRTQQRQLGHQLRQDRLESPPRALQRCFDRMRFAVGTNDEVDRTVLEMPASLGESGAERAKRTV